MSISVRSRQGPTGVRAAWVVRTVLAALLCGLGVLAGTPAAVAAAPAAAARAAPGPATSDDIFLAIREAIHAGNLDAAAAYKVRLDTLDPDYPLAPYVDYYIISQRLHNPADPLDDGVVKAFIARYPGSLVADLARRDWLLALGRRGDFETFDGVYGDYVANDDDQVACYALEAHYLRLKRRGEMFGEPLLAAIDEALSVPKDLAQDGCYNLMLLMSQEGRLTPTQLWRGARLASDNNQPLALKRYLALLPPGEAPKPEALDALYDKPALWLAKHVGEPLRGQEGLVVLALSRMARAAPDETQVQFERSWASRLSNDARGWVWAELGAAAAKRLMPEALEWSRRSLDVNGLSEDLLTARTRAALREQNWKLVEQFIEKMPPDLRRPQSAEGAWVYWLARAKRATGDEAEAVALWATLSSQFNFYGQLAAEELGQTLSLPPPAAPVTDVELAAVSGLPGFTRAQKFYQLNLRPQGNAEWNFTLHGMSDRQLLASAEFARRKALLDRAVNTADRTRNEHDFNMRFLMPFQDSLQAKASAVGLNLDWVYGLIRQESRFVQVARSSVGAAGLMQLMPGTAKYVARKIGMTDYRADQVSDLDTNLTLGTTYLKLVLDELDDQEVLATAAYNAGPGRPRAWRATLPAPVEGAIFAETIPFPETRDYVKKVMSNAVYYSLLLKPGQRQSLRARMGSVAPGGSAASGDLP